MNLTFQSESAPDFTVDPALRQLIETAGTTPLERSAVASLAELLPADDAILDAVMAQEIAHENARSVTALMLAGIIKARPVDARHLATSAHLLDNPAILGCLAFHCTGDVPLALCEAVERGYMSTDRDVVALVSAALWQREHDDVQLPDSLARNARKIARNVFNSLEIKILLADLAVLTANVDLGVILGFPEGTLASDDSLSPIAEGVKAMCAGDLGKFWTLLEQGPKTVDLVVPSGHPIHRVTPRISRNAPCPCGSGLKYKKCCIEKDRARESEASDIPGITRIELEENLEQYLDEHRIASLRNHTLAALDPLKIPPELRYRVLSRLVTHQRLDAAMNILLTFPPGYDITDMWWELIYAAVDAGRTDIVGRLAQLPVKDEDERARVLDSFCVRYILATPEQRSLVDRLENEAEKLLRAASCGTGELAGDLESASCPALAILAARAAVLEDIRDFPMDEQIDVIGRCRDELLLPVAEPAEELLASRLDADEELEEHESAKKQLNDARGQVSEKERELDAVRRQLADVREQLAHHARVRERRLVRDSKKSGGGEAHTSTTEKALRQRIAELKSTVGAFHAEKQQLVLKLRDIRQEAATRVETGRLQESSRPPEPEDDLERFSEVELGIQPVRIPVFSSECRKALQKVPKDVAARAMSIAGSLAAGEAKAFTDARHLKLAGGQLRVRVGRSYRLIFRLEGDDIEFLKLIHRRDLERILAR